MVLLKLHLIYLSADSVIYCDCQLNDSVKSYFRSLGLIICVSVCFITQGKLWSQIEDSHCPICRIYCSVRFVSPHVRPRLLDKFHQLPKKVNDQ